MCISGSHFSDCSRHALYPVSTAAFVLNYLLKLLCHVVILLIFHRFIFVSEFYFWCLMLLVEFLEATEKKVHDCVW